MSKPFHWQDPETVPKSVRSLAQKHNNLAEDVDRITGSTEPEKIEAWELFKRFREGWHWLHDKRYNIFLASFQVFIATKLLEAFGVDLKQYGPQMVQVVHSILQWLYP